MASLTVVTLIHAELVALSICYVTYACIARHMHHEEIGVSSNVDCYSVCESDGSKYMQ